MITLTELNSSRKFNYTVIFILLVIFTGSIASIKFIYGDSKKDEDKESTDETINEETINEETTEETNKDNLIEENDDNKDSLLKQWARFLIPLFAIGAFFIACCFISKIIVDGNSPLLSKSRDQYIGIIFLVLVASILTVLNLTVLKNVKLTDYIKGKKFSTVGVIMALGISAIIFGFLDNFGMKLGTDALDDSFLQLFLSPFSVDSRFKEHSNVIQDNLKYVNNWANSKWKSVINQVLRFKDEIADASKQNNNSMKDLIEDIQEFMEDGALPLIIPKEIREINNKKLGTHAFVKNIKEKYEVIDGSKSMLGNTFSDFMGAILGAGIINLFVYMTSYDSVYTGDDNIDNNTLITNLSKYSPFMEALFIALGCLIPVFINIAMTRNDYNTNNRNSWIVLSVISLIIIVMMYYSVFGIKDMTLKDKKNSIKKTMNDLKDRLDITNKKDDKTLNKDIDAFINSL